jgi:hypothetical protein
MGLSFILFRLHGRTILTSWCRLDGQNAALKGGHMKTIQVFSPFLAAFLIVAVPGFAREKSNEELAMVAQNPEANLVSLPLQDNMTRRWWSTKS